MGWTDLGRERVAPKEAVEMAKPLESAHTLLTVWQKYLEKSVGQKWCRPIGFWESAKRRAEEF